MNRFEAESLTAQKILKVLTDVLGEWVDSAGQHRLLDELILNKNSSLHTCSRDLQTIFIFEKRGAAPLG